MSEKKKAGFFDGIIWWKIDKSELEKQVSEYDQLKIYQSARGISLLLWLFSIGVTLLFSYLGTFDDSAIYGAILYLIIGLFVFKGYKWAMIVSMIMWTIEKGYGLISSFDVGSTSTSNPLIAIIWWALYMHTFYLAFKVEQARSKKISSGKYCSSCGTQNQDHAKFCGKCGSIIS